jgi:nitrite reductase/ring-hydroxylating ferredoxin subunit
MQDANDGRKSYRNQPYNAYYNRPRAQDDFSLTQVGPGTPGGEYLRRFWHPVMLQSQLKDLPKAVRILGEDLVIFRDKSNRVGLLHRHCSHRGASLEFGIPVERGIRCCYHGWHYDIDGTILETPAEPPTNRIKNTLCHGAYPTRETKEFIFAYMGPADFMPPLPAYDTFTHPEGNRVLPFMLHWPCNWLQIQENGADPIHTAYLHAIATTQFSKAFAQPSALDFIQTPLGFLAMATRRVGDFIFFRSSDIVMPNFAQFPTGLTPADTEKFAISCGLSRWIVPIDDCSSFTIGVRHLNNVMNPKGELKEYMVGVGRTGFIGQTEDRPYEERQVEPGDFDAIVSQGPITNRRNEHLGLTDRGIGMLRRMVARGIEAVKEGEALTVPKYSDSALTPTYTHDLVVKLPSQFNISDLDVLSRYGRAAAKIVIETDHLPPKEREAVARGQIEKLLTHDLVN